MEPMCPMEATPGRTLRRECRDRDARRRQERHTAPLTVEIRPCGGDWSTMMKGVPPHPRSPPCMLERDLGKLGLL